MLDSHPEMAIPGESHFVAKLWRWRRWFRSGDGVDAERLARTIMRTPHFRLWALPEETVWRRVRVLEKPGYAEVVGAIFAAYADHHGKPRWGDKTPIYVRSLPLLGRLFPEARFVHLVRDGRDVALSYLSVPWGPGTIWQAAHKWRRDVTAGRAAGAVLGPGRYLEVRYEQLVREPRPVLERVCAFAGLSFHEEMLNHERDAEDRIQAPPDGLPYHASAARPPTPGLRDWRSQMPARDVLAFEAVAGRLLSELGYERRYPVVPPSWRLRGALWARALNAWAAGSGAKRAVRGALRRRPRPRGASGAAPVPGEPPRSPMSALTPEPAEAEPTWWVDPESGTREEPHFFGPGELRMYGCLHTPVGPSRGGVVICCPLHAEVVRNYRKEVLVARSLAARGLSVLRFHYRGSGNSDGESAEATFDTMRDDAAAAAEWLVERTGVASLAFLGTRWGGLIAAAAAARFEGSALALWEPAVDPVRYFRDVFRARLILDLKEGRASRPSTEALVQELRDRGTVDVLGYGIDRALYESAQGHSLADELGDSPRPVLLVQIGQGPALRGDLEGLRTRWEDLGFPVEARVVAEDAEGEAWWFSGPSGATDTRAGTTALIDITTAWAVRWVSAERAEA